MFAVACMGIAIGAIAGEKPSEPPALALDAQPLVYTRDGATQGCGVRLTGGEPGGEGPSAWFDFSFAVFRRGIALAQSIAYEIRRSETGESRPALRPVQSTWIAAWEGRVRRGENDERRDTLVYRLVLDDAVALFQAVAHGQPLRLGIRPWGQRNESVYTGTTALTEESRTRIGECLAALTSEGQRAP